MKKQRGITTNSTLKVLCFGMPSKTTMRKRKPRIPTRARKFRVEKMITTMQPRAINIVVG